MGGEEPKYQMNQLYQDKYRRLKKIITLIVFISLFSLFLSFDFDTRESISFEYHIEVTPSRNVEYILYIPIPFMKYEMKIR